MGNESQKKWTPSEAQWSNFFQKLLLTHEDCSLASTNEGSSFDKIFVLTRHYHWDDGVRCALSYIDLSSSCKDNDNSIQSLQPILQFQNVLGYFLYHAYAVVGSKLFMFCGVDLRKRREETSWCSYDFSRDMCSSTTINIDKKFVESGPPMKGTKYSPVAAVVGGHKICVFATVLFRRYPLVEIPNFEVFNPTDGSWTELPELPNYTEYKLDEICIRSYCIERSFLIVCTDIGIYGININDRVPKWVGMEGSESIESGPFNGRWAVVGKNICSPFEMTRWGEQQSYPLGFRNKGPFMPDDGCGVLCSERVANGIKLCSVQGKLVPHTRVPVLWVNVAKFNTELLRNLNGDMWNAVQSENSASFEIKSQKCDFMNIIGCFRVKGTAFRVPLYYPRYEKGDYETMEEWRLDLLLSQYGFNLKSATIQQKRDFAMGAFLWPDQW